jgi:hypothetical protein
VRLLLERGADINAGDGRATALHERPGGATSPWWSCCSRTAPTRGRGPRVGATPASWAEHGGHASLAELLRSRETPS